ncbi:MAG TPA: TIM barrel protein [Lacunisphaera sp.]|nr:TIM barrel protein [Lacunisphaera sp.]
MAVASVTLAASGHVVSVRGPDILLDGAPVKLLGLRTSNALMSDATTQELIDHLDAFRSHGVNTISVYVMGSRFGDVKGYRPDASLDPVYAARLARILAEADRRGMIVLVGCLYWSESAAKAGLAHWTQREADLAVANTVRWLNEQGFRNVIVDPDNEGMASRDPDKRWDIGQMIEAGHAADPSAVIAYNARPTPPADADLTIHHAPRVPGKPYVETEGTPQVVPYWHEYSRREGYRNYLNSGLYNTAMKAEQFRDTDEGVTRGNGFLLASTWLQVAPPDGPNQHPGGEGTPGDPGVRWWLDYIRTRHGPGRTMSARSFFALDNGVGRGEWTPAQQAAALRETGFDGISYNYTNPADLKTWQEELTRRGLRLFGLYFAAPLQGDRPFPPGLDEAVHLLRRSGTVLWMHLPARPRTPESEAIALARIRAVADLAAGADLRVVLYPHVNCLPATAEEALALAEKAGRPNVGVGFNLSHELAAGNGARVPEILRRVASRLEMVTVNGATDRPGPLWENYIQRLGEGDYDIARLLRVLAEVDYRGPVGLQSYGLTGDARDNLQASLRAWEILNPP